jgi:hypothetical protein
MREWTDYYGNVHRETLSGDEIEELGRKYRYWDDQVKAGNADAEVFGRRIEENTGVIADHSQQMRQLARALDIPLQKYKQFPQAVRTRFESKGLPQTAADALRLIREYKALQNFKRIRAVVSAPGVALTREQVKRLGEQYKLTPKQVRTLLRVEGIGKVQGAVRDTRRQLDDVSNARANVTKWVADVFGGTQEAKGKAERGAGDVRQNLERGASGARADLGAFNSSINNGLNVARSTASSGGVGVGNALEAGVISGFASTQSALAADAASAVSAAVAAARRAADAKSPSRKMRQIGEWMGQGLTEGISRHERNAAVAGRRLANAALVGSAGSRRWGVSSSVAAPGGRIADGHRYTFVIEGRPFTAIARREIAEDRNWGRRLEDRD